MNILDIFNFNKPSLSDVNLKQSDLDNAAKIVKRICTEMRLADGKNEVKLTLSETYNTVKNMDDSAKMSLCVYCAQRLINYHTEYKLGDGLSRSDFHVVNDFSSLIFRNYIEAPDNYFIYIINAVKKSLKDYQEYIIYFPYTPFISQIEKHVDKHGLSEILAKSLTKLRSKEANHRESILRNARIDAILSGKKTKATIDFADYIFNKDAVGKLMQIFFEKHQENAQFKELIVLYTEGAERATPTQKWQKKAVELIAVLGKETIRNFGYSIFETTIDHFTKCHKLTHLHTGLAFDYANSGKENYSNSDIWFSSRNELIIRNMVWLTPFIYDQSYISLVSDLGLISLKKYSGIGGLSMKIGSASLYAFSQLPNREGIVYLTKFDQKIKNNHVKKTIDKYILELAMLSGKTTLELEEEAVPTFNLDNSFAFSTDFGNVKATTSIISNSKISTIWSDEKGKSFKSVPSSIKAEFTNDLKAFNLKNKHIQAQLMTQSKRIEEMYVMDRKWTFSNWEALYNASSLLGFLGQKTIWAFETEGVHESGIARDGRLVNVEEGPLSINDKTIVKLWHPINYSVQEVSEWRDFILKNSIVQPFKQAFREVYFVTDAELNTDTYSNRFAAHILKNYQFGALCKTRDWNGFNPFHFDGSMPAKHLKQHDISAQYWIDIVGNGDSGDYVTTDQVRFYQNNRQLRMSEVPKIVFTELMRDVDMFVAVCSIGSDPNWQNDNVNNRLNDYWTSYSFGELTETAKTRKQILEKLLPKLKIAKIAHLEDKFLVVKGNIRSYKIHLGSTNILMTPNDQYLCIVPDRSAAKQQNLYLPFEGDSGLSVIISKAILLADDDKITDRTILSQINRR